MDQVDVVVIGCGVAGATTAGRLTLGGLNVCVLERATTFVDRVRGEFMPPWGVKEVFDLGLGDLLFSVPKVNVIAGLVPYDETIAVEIAEANRVPFDRMLPGIPGAAGVSHPGLSEAALEYCVTTGAEVHRGVTDVAVSAGVRPSVTYMLNGRRREVESRLVIGADGRESTVRRQVGLKLESTTPRVFMGGMLVDGTEEWPREWCTGGVEGDVHFLVFPQASGITRLYLAWDAEQPHRFSGPDRQHNFLQAFDCRCLPYGEAFAQATPIGPLAAVPMTDTWIDRPCADGVVLVGDAAGWSDPVIGQGLSIAFRDARVLSDLLLARDNWETANLDEYYQERAERMRRLRFSMRLMGLGLFGPEGQVFGPEAPAYRKALSRLTRKDPTFAAHRAAPLVGPGRVPAEAFSQDILQMALTATA